MLLKWLENFLTCFQMSTKFLFLVSQILEWIEYKFMSFYCEQIKINAHTNRKMKLYMIGEKLIRMMDVLMVIKSIFAKAYWVFWFF